MVERLSEEDLNINHLVKLAHKNFLENEWVPREDDYKEPYGVDYACYAVLERLDVNSFELFATLAAQTSLKPKDLDFGTLDAEHFPAMMRTLSEIILAGEVGKRYPEIRVEVSRRFRESDDARAS